MKPQFAQVSALIVFIAAVDSIGCSPVVSLRPHFKAAERPIQKSILPIEQKGIIAKDGWSETPLKTVGNVEIYVSTPPGYSNCNRTSFSLYWNIPTSQVITSERDIGLIEHHIMPAIIPSCSNIRLWKIYHFIKGKPFINEKGKETAFSGREYYKRNGTLRRGISATGRAAYMYKSYDDAVEGLKRHQQAMEDSRRSGEENRAKQDAFYESMRKAKEERIKQAIKENRKPPCSVVGSTSTLMCNMARDRGENCRLNISVDGYDTRCEEDW